MHFRSFIVAPLLTSLCMQTVESCVDDITYTFTLLWDNDTEVNCSWLTKNSLKAATRKATYCDNYTAIRAACAVSCNNCTSAPTKAPTKNPTKAPTKNPTKAPTKAPTDPPTKSPTKAPTDPPTKFPTRNPTKAPTKAPTDPPTKSPTKAPTDPPTKAPTKNPTKSPTDPPTKAPTKNPTKAPTKAPTEAPTGPCADSTTYSWMNIDEVSVDCAWLTKNVNNVAYRIGRWCPEAAIGYACPLTCGTCRNGCTDDPSWTFTLFNEGTAKNCSWITVNYLKVDIRRSTYCGNEEVVGKCPESCGVCP
eukprot:CAMPEP_0194095536 /NCGR_PEP_ID=MMETSP0149-20130528/56879_1 /TAXON_ID=122233 /ORGANISM="Chaetoceros debilis, Strain MM31A-1" /LENGTH=304 /DNA_ID=CAMNT_0038781481 /DNA_START=117 /DNA_END=1031 /DNA_ORIENTATION=+